MWSQGLPWFWKLGPTVFKDWPTCCSWAPASLYTNDNEAHCTESSANRYLPSNLDAPGSHSNFHPAFLCLASDNWRCNWHCTFALFPLCQTKKFFEDWAGYNVYIHNHNCQYLLDLPDPCLIDTIPSGPGGRWHNWNSIFSIQAYF